MHHVSRELISDEGKFGIISIIIGLTSTFFQD